VIYPPDKRYLSQLESAEGQKAKLARIGPSLKGGIIMKTTSAEAIYLPAGCIHATFTIEGGYLIALDFTTMGSMKAFSTYIASGMDFFLGAKKRVDYNVNFILLRVGSSDVGIAAGRQCSSSACH
jgi:hypothetical protein